MTTEQIQLLTKLFDSGTEVKAIVKSAEQTTRSIRAGKRAVTTTVPIKAAEAATVSFMKIVPIAGEKLATQDFEICIRIGGTRICVSVDFDAMVA